VNSPASGWYTPRRPIRLISMKGFDLIWGAEVALVLVFAVAAIDHGDDPILLIILLCLAGIAALAAVVRSRASVSAKLFLSCLSCIIFVSEGYGLRERYLAEHPPVILSYDNKIKIDCKDVGTASERTESGTYYMHEFSEPAESGGGVAQITSAPGTLVWGAPNIFLVKCSVTNLEPSPILSLGSALHVAWLEPNFTADGKSETSGRQIASADHPFVLPTIPNGPLPTFDFYLLNIGKNFVKISLPKTAEITAPDIRGKRTVVLVPPSDIPFFLSPYPTHPLRSIPAAPARTPDIRSRTAAATPQAGAGVPPAAREQTGPPNASPAAVAPQVVISKPSQTETTYEIAGIRFAASVPVIVEAGPPARIRIKITVGRSGAPKITDTDRIDISYYDEVPDWKLLTPRTTCKGDQKSVARTIASLLVGTSDSQYVEFLCSRAVSQGETGTLDLTIRQKTPTENGLYAYSFDTAPFQ